MTKCDFCEEPAHRIFTVKWLTFDIAACKVHCVLACKIQIKYLEKLKDIANELYEEVFQYSKQLED